MLFPNFCFDLSCPEIPVCASWERKGCQIDDGWYGREIV